MPTAAEKPWVLIRKDRPNCWFSSREEAMGFFDRLRLQGRGQPKAALRGPHEGWRCHGNRHAQWVRDDNVLRRLPGEADGDGNGNGNPPEAA